MNQRTILQRALDGGLFLATVIAVALPFIDNMPVWALMAALVCFVAMFFVRFWVADDRKAWMKANWLDLVIIVLLSSPLLRMLMALRFAHLLPALRVGALIRANKDRLIRLILVSGDSLPVALSLVFGLVFVFGTITFLLEHGHHPQFGVLQDGLWWAFVTLTTVGYGDVVPITPGGRMAAVLTMVIGIIVYSLVVANLTVFLEEYGRTHPVRSKKSDANTLPAEAEQDPQRTDQGQKE